MDVRAKGAKTEFLIRTAMGPVRNTKNGRQNWNY